MASERESMNEERWSLDSRFAEAAARADYMTRLWDEAVVDKERMIRKNELEAKRIAELDVDLTNKSLELSTSQDSVRALQAEKEAHRVDLDKWSTEFTDLNTNLRKFANDKAVADAEILRLRGEVNSLTEAKRTLSEELEQLRASPSPVIELVPVDLREGVSPEVGLILSCIRSLTKTEKSLIRSEVRVDLLREFNTGEDPKFGKAFHAEIDILSEKRSKLGLPLDLDDKIFGDEGFDEEFVDGEEGDDESNPTSDNSQVGGGDADGIAIVVKD